MVVVFLHPWRNHDSWFVCIDYELDRIWRFAVTEQKNIQWVMDATFRGGG